MYTARVFNVMLASPSDVASERRIARDVIHEWNYVNSDSRRVILMPIGWETHSSPVLGDRPQAIINEQVLKRSDLLVAIFWTRLGTSTGVAVSGTAEEIEKHVMAGKPAMLYFSSAPVVPSSVDLEQFSALQAFRDAIKHRGLIESFESLAEFKEKFSRQLAHLLNTHNYFGDRENNPATEQVNGKTPKAGYPIESGVSPDLVGSQTFSALIERKASLADRVSSDAASLLREAVKDEEGTIIRLEGFGGLEISTNGRNFVETSEAREEARWEAALGELFEHGLINDKGGHGEIFGITKRGYQVADALGN
ncbi:MAG TPA: DUF4062 domain-containing protein [Thermoanaerobaculia bacterium]|nr:DUF4062 domain-containing protein [Thermoanaerobaculia bacterium]